MINKIKQNKLQNIYVQKEIRNLDIVVVSFLKYFFKLDLQIS